ncbi:MAG: hypothetical protein JXR07_06660 [Reichenbachiella sp.]
MNKKKFVEFIKTPEEMSVSDLAELQKVINEAPYFQSAYTVMAKGCRILKQKAAPRITQRAALYATNRDVFKGYLTAVNKKKPLKPSPEVTQTSKISNVDKGIKGNTGTQDVSKGGQDELIKEIYENLEQWKIHREEYLEYEKEHPQDIVIEEVEKADTTSSPAPKDNIEQIDSAQDPDPVELLKNQVADEVKAEETEADQAIEKAILGKPLPDSDSTSEKEDGNDDVIDEVPEGSVYSFGTKIPEPESLPETEPEPLPNSDASKKTDLSDLISSEELSAIVDETEAEIIAEEAKEKQKEGPLIEALDEITIEDLSPKEDAKSEEVVSDKIEPSEVTEPIPTESELEIVDGHEDVEEIIIPESEDDTPRDAKIEEADSIKNKGEIQKIDEEDLQPNEPIESKVSAADSEAELSEIEHQKEELKKQSRQGLKNKKFRLSVLKRPIKFTKPKKSASKKKKAEEPTSEVVKPNTTKTAKSKKEAAPKKSSVKKSDAKKATPKKKTAKATTPKKVDKEKKAAPKEKKPAAKKAKTPKATTKKAAIKSKDEVKKKPKK